MMRPPNMYEYHGKLYTISDLARKSGISQDALRSRINRGWSIAAAVETPVIVAYRPRKNRTATTTENSAPYLAALNICKTISGDPDGHNFRQIAPGIYAFDGDILSWRINFGIGSAQLAAYYRATGAKSTFSRDYKINGSIATEV